MARVNQTVAIAEHDYYTTSERPVDLVHLAKYTMGNRDLEHEVLNLFARQSTIYLERLRKAADTQTWVEAAHTLKGSACGIGAWHVAEVVEAIETLNFAADTEDKRDKMLELAESIEQANSFIEGLLDKEMAH